MPADFGKAVGNGMSVQVKFRVPEKLLREIEKRAKAADISRNSQILAMITRGMQVESLEGAVKEAIAKQLGEMG